MPVPQQPPRRRNAWTATTAPKWDTNPTAKAHCKEQPDFAEPPLSLEGAADHWNHREDTDYFSQPGKLFRLMTPAQQQVLFENTARSVGGASETSSSAIAHCTQADPAYGAGVAKGAGSAQGGLSDCEGPQRPACAGRFHRIRSVRIIYRPLATEENP